MPAPRKYTEELRERAIRMVRETVNDNPGLAHKPGSTDDVVDVAVVGLIGW